MTSNLILFEFGSTSLKCYYRHSELGPIETHKIPWLVSHEVYQTGRISTASSLKASCAIQALLSCFGGYCETQAIVAFGTGVFREAKNILEFILQIWRRTGLSLKILTEDQEAALLKSLCLSSLPALPAFAFDLGGGSLQWVHIQTVKSSARGSIPIGAIRLSKLAGDSFQNFMPVLARDLAGKFLEELPRVGLPQIIGTGGTVKALAKITGRMVIRREILDQVVHRIGQSGPPPDLKFHRRPIFLPGLIILQQLLQDTAAEEIRYQELSIGKALLEKVLALQEEIRKPLRASQILKQVKYSAVLPRASPFQTWKHSSPRIA